MMFSKFFCICLLLCSIQVHAARYSENEKLSIPNLSDVVTHKKYKSQLVGKPSIIFFWASWCNYCKEIIPTLNELSGSNEYNILGINADEDRNDAVKAIKKFDFKFSNLFDEKEKFRKKLGIEKIPCILILDKSQTVRFIQIGLKSQKKEILLGKLEFLKNEK